ncbi:MAG: hypothetical protein PHR36_01735, partial [Patescibacteria group bacterium]|nr:hypothetical protein [Patescibacteria group bacterium]
MDIDFLPDKDKKNKPSREQKEEGNLGEKVEWSSPKEKETPLESPGEKKGIKNYLPDFFNAPLLGRKKEEAGAAHPNNLIDRNKLKESRKELLELISEQKKTDNPPAVGQTEKVKAPRAPKKRPEIWLKVTKLFKPVSAIFGKKDKKSEAGA